MGNGIGAELRIFKVSKSKAVQYAQINLWFIPKTAHYYLIPTPKSQRNGIHCVIYWRLPLILRPSQTKKYGGYVPRMGLMSGKRLFLTGLKSMGADAPSATT